MTRDERNDWIIAFGWFVFASALVSLFLFAFPELFR